MDGIKTTLRILLLLILLTLTSLIFLGNWAYLTGDDIDRSEIESALILTGYKLGLVSDHTLHLWLKKPRTDAARFHVTRSIRDQNSNKSVQIQKLHSLLNGKGDLLGPISKNRLAMTNEESAEHLQRTDPLKLPDDVSDF